jgi:spore maturation protein CgeE
MKTPKNILESEKSYTEYFSEKKQVNGGIRYRDELVPDMYDYNYTYLYEQKDAQRLGRIIETEISDAKHEGLGFCKLSMDFIFPDSLLKRLPENTIVKKVGYYVFDISRLPDLKVKEGITIKPVNTRQRGDDLTEIETQMGVDTALGNDFRSRRTKRRTQIYMSDKPVNCFVCYYEAQPIGSCDLLIRRGTAKIEEFCVVPRMRGRGFGTAILRDMIDRADICGASTIYLCTYEDDTPKDMYTAIGFSKVGERTEIVIPFEEAEPETEETEQAGDSDQPIS